MRGARRPGGGQAPRGAASEGVAPVGVALELAREQLGRGGLVRVRVRGRSMWPAFLDGQVVAIQGVRSEALRVGDVVLYQRGEALVLHRVVRLRGDWLWVQGDARPRPDGRLDRRAVLGRAPRRLGDRLRGRWVPWRARLGRAGRLGKRLFFDAILGRL